MTKAERNSKRRNKRNAVVNNIGEVREVMAQHGVTFKRELKHPGIVGFNQRKGRGYTGHSYKKGAKYVPTLEGKILSREDAAKRQAANIARNSAGPIGGYIGNVE